MKIIRWLAGIVGVLVVFALAVGWMLPSGFEVKRSMEIAALPAKVYPLVADPRGWAKWSAWNKRDPSMQVTYGGAASGQGATWDWVSKTEGTGHMEFTRAEPDKRIDYALAFPDYGMRSSGALVLEPVGSGTRVTWNNVGDVGGNPFKHIFAAFMDKLVGPDFEAGLRGLKAVAEAP